MHSMQERCDYCHDRPQSLLADRHDSLYLLALPFVLLACNPLLSIAIVACCPDWIASDFVGKIVLLFVKDLAVVGSVIVCGLFARRSSWLAATWIAFVALSIPLVTVLIVAAFVYFYAR